jgi:hypothetical protein
MRRSVPTMTHRSRSCSLMITPMPGASKEAVEKGSARMES